MPAKNPRTDRLSRLTGNGHASAPNRQTRGNRLLSSDLPAPTPSGRSAARLRSQVFVSGNVIGHGLDTRYFLIPVPVHTGGAALHLFRTRPYPQFRTLCTLGHKAERTVQIFYRIQPPLCFPFVKNINIPKPCFFTAGTITAHIKQRRSGEGFYGHAGSVILHYFELPIIPADCRVVITAGDEGKCTGVPASRWHWPDCT